MVHLRCTPTASASTLPRHAISGDPSDVSATLRGVRLNFLMQGPAETKKTSSLVAGNMEATRDQELITDRHKRKSAISGRSIDAPHCLVLLPLFLLFPSPRRGH